MKEKKLKNIYSTKEQKFCLKKKAKESFQEGMDVASTFEGPGPGPDAFGGFGMNESGPTTCVCGSFVSASAPSIMNHAHWSYYNVRKVRQGQYNKVI
jgi:hypothetical protein